MHKTFRFFCADFFVCQTFRGVPLFGLVWLSRLAVKVGCQGWLSRLVVKVDCQGWSSRLVVKVGFQSWLSKLVVKVGRQIELNENCLRTCDMT